MIRVATDPRPDWQAKVEAEGLIWHSVDDRPYWDESVHYRFSAAQIAEIEGATAELYRLFLAAGIGIREDGLITGNTARFVPHVIEG